VHTDIVPILSAHPGLWHRARFVRLDFELASSGDRVRVRVDGQDVRVEPVAQGDDGERDFVLSAPASSWEEFKRDMPRPGFNDIIALVESGNATFSGEGLPFFRNLFLVKGIVSAVMRGDARW
jgi:hypothetical protein